MLTNTRKLVDEKPIYIISQRKIFYWQKPLEPRCTQFFKFFEHSFNNGDKLEEKDNPMF